MACTIVIYASYNNKQGFSYKDSEHLVIDGNSSYLLIRLIWHTHHGKMAKMFDLLKSCIVIAEMM